MTTAQAIEKVVQTDPDLWTQHILCQRTGERPAPVAKAAPPSYEQILKAATARAAATGGTRREAMVQLVEEHPHEQAYYAAYRKYHLTDGIQDHAQARRGAGGAYHG